MEIDNDVLNANRNADHTESAPAVASASRSAAASDVRPLAMDWRKFLPWGVGIIVLLLLVWLLTRRRGGAPSGGGAA